MNEVMLAGVCVLVSFIVTAVFMSCYKEDFKIEYKNDKSITHKAIIDHALLLSNLGSEIDILRARVYDLENKLKEMEKLDDGK